MRLGVAMRRRVWALSAVSAVLLATSAGAAADPPARPPPLGAGEPAPPPPWRRSVDIGIDVAQISRPASSIEDGLPTPVRYETAVGYGFHGRIEILRHLRFTAYFLSASHDVALPRGSLGQSGALSMDSAWTYSFGARLMPTWPFTERLRSWVSVGAGWGRIEFGRMTVTEGGGQFMVRERESSFVEVPLGIGTSFEIIPRWLALEVEVTGAFVVGQQGSSIETGQGIDAAGKVRSIGSLPRLDAAFVQTLGLSLLL